MANTVADAEKQVKKRERVKRTGRKRKEEKNRKVRK